MKVAILCGGKGTRLRELTGVLPKPLVEIGGKPILWHIMKIYSYYGFNDFILCLGYKGEMIKEYFMNQADWRYNDFILDFKSKKHEIIYKANNYKVKHEDWKITFVDTGQETNTGGRIKKIEEYIGGDDFFVTYGDGLSDIDLNKLLDFHKKNKKIATITCVNPPSQFGVVEINEEGIITKFEEKPLLNQWISGGFFVFNKRIFDYIRENDILEKEPFEKLAKERQAIAYKHKGFWKCMDTYKDTRVLNELWKNNKAYWKKWS